MAHDLVAQGLRTVRRAVFVRGELCIKPSTCELGPVYCCVCYLALACAFKLTSFFLPAFLRYSSFRFFRKTPISLAKKNSATVGVGVRILFHSSFPLGVMSGLVSGFKSRSAVVFSVTPESWILKCCQWYWSNFLA